RGWRATVGMVLAATAAGLSACTASSSEMAAPTRGPEPTRSTATISPAPTRGPTPPLSQPSQKLVAFDATAAWSTARTLSERIGPRESTTRAYRRAASLVDDRLTRLGYRVHRQRLRVPAGVSWGIPVPAGSTENVIGQPRGFDPRKPYVIVGAQLDTVPQAPGAEDNGSGGGGMLELARMAAAQPPPLPVVFVAFAAEEPRGSGDNRHHYGSRAYVRAMSATAKKSLAGMLNPDRVGVGTRVPICTGGVGTDAVA